MKAPALVPCPGCGGRNPRGAPFCDWCARPFVAQGRPISARWVRLAASLVFAALVAGVVLLAVLNASRPTPRAAPSPTLTPLPTPAATATRLPSLGLAAPPEGESSPTPTPPRPNPSVTPQPERGARIANTDGVGVFLRTEPSTNARTITALREGTSVTVLAEEQVTAARVWRRVRDPRGTEGWVLADFLRFDE